MKKNKANNFCIVCLFILTPFLWHFFCTYQDDRKIPKVFYSGGNVLDYYVIKDRNAMQITWSHGVNSEAELNIAVNGKFPVYFDLKPAFF